MTQERIIISKEFINPKLLDLYSELMICDQTTSELCKSLIWSKDQLPKDITKIPPYFMERRAFFNHNRSCPVLVIGLNPGHPYPKDFESNPEFESKYLAFTNKNDRRKFLVLNHFEELYTLITNFDSIYERANRKEKSSLRFWKRTNEYCQILFNSPESRTQIASNQLFDIINYTNLVKCSTRLERNGVTNNLARNCIKKWLIQELNLIQPKIILCLGIGTSHFLIQGLKNIDQELIKLDLSNFEPFQHDGLKQQVALKLGQIEYLSSHQKKTGVIFAIKHPSYAINKDYKQKALEWLKEEIEGKKHTTNCNLKPLEDK